MDAPTNSSTEDNSEATSRAGVPESAVDSYRRLADVFHAVLSEQRLELLLDHIADTLAELVPYDTLSIYQADEGKRRLKAVLARDQYSEEILSGNGLGFGEGITGWAVEHREPVLSNDAMADPRAEVIPGTSDDEQDSMISVPLIANGSVKGALNIYRLGGHSFFTDDDFELAKRFGDAAALALDNAQVRAALEHQAQTDSLTGLFNHRYFHERLRAELTRVNRAQDSLVVLMLDIDDFKKINDVHSHSVGDQILVKLAEAITFEIRASDVACRLGGEEFAIIMPSCEAGDAGNLAERLAARMAKTAFGPVGHITASMGIAEGPRHAVGSNELVASAEAAMMMAKADGKNRTVVFEDEPARRPETGGRRDLRTSVHLKMLKSLAGKLNGLNSPEVIASTIVEELRSFIEYDTCRVYKLEGDLVVPLAARSPGGNEDIRRLFHRVGEGLTGRVARSGQILWVPNVLDYEHALPVFESDRAPQSVIAVPLRYGRRVLGVIVVSRMKVGSLDEDDVRLLEVLAGHAAGAFENARLYEAQRREADDAKGLVDLAHAMFMATSIESIGAEAARMGAQLLDSDQAILWLQDEDTGEFFIAGYFGVAADASLAPILGYRMGKEIERVFTDKEHPSVIPAERIVASFPERAGVVARPLAAAPMKIDTGVEGWLTVRHPDTEAWYFTPDRLRLLAAIAHEVSVAIQKDRLYKQQRETAEAANALLDFSRELAKPGGRTEVLDRTVELAGSILEVDRVSVWLRDPATGELVAERVWGYSGPERQWTEGLRLSSDVADALLARTEPYLVQPEEVADIPGLPKGVPDMVYARVPFELPDNGGGFLVAAVLADVGERAFPERKLRVLEGIAHQARLALLNLDGIEGIERTFLSTVEALANALEAKDEYISSHARSIKDMALRVGVELGLARSRLKNLELAALFHDIGKIGMPSNILAKPGPLTVEERKIIETHPEVGERILAPIERLTDVRHIVRACHERYDGRGYPDGRSGDDIPIEARVIFVCDAFHAMTSDRPYRNRVSVDEACRRLNEAAGTQFDPRIVEVFLSVRGCEDEPIPSESQALSLTRP